MFQLIAKTPCLLFLLIYWIKKLHYFQCVILCLLFQSKVFMSCCFFAEPQHKFKNLIPLLQFVICHSPVLRRFIIFFKIVLDKLTGLPVLSAAWIIINTRSEMSMGVHVKCVPWFHEANKSTDIKEMKRVLVWVFTKRLSSGEVTVTPYPNPYSWWLSLYQDALKEYRQIPHCPTQYVSHWYLCQYIKKSYASVLSISFMIHLTSHYLIVGSYPFSLGTRITISSTGYYVCYALL